MYKHFNNIIINIGIFKSLLSVLMIKYNNYHKKLQFFMKSNETHFVYL